MTRPIDQLAVRRQLLVARSSLCRLKLRHEFEVVRESVSVRRAAGAVARSLPLRSAAFLVAVEGLGRERVARWIAFAARALAVARMAALASALLRRPPPVSPGDGRLPP